MLFREEFWNGNISPGEGRYHSQKEYKNAWRLVEQTEDELKERLTAEDWELFIAVHASDVHNLRGSDAHAATGASVLAAAALARGDTAESRNAVVSTSAADMEAAELVPIDKNVTQLVL